MVRRWSRDTRLNGREFDDSWLQPGDRLTLGQIELEVLDDCLPEESLSGSADPAPATAADGDPALSASQPESELATEPVNEIETRPLAQPAVERVTEVETDPSATESANDLRDRFEVRLQQLLEHERLVTECAEGLERQRSEFEAEREQWSQAREAELTELTTREECLGSLREEIELERQALVREKQASQQRETDLEDLAKFEAEREQWSQVREAVLAELKAREEGLRSLREEIDLERQALVREQQASQQRETDLEDQAKFEAEREQWSQVREAELAELKAREEGLRSLREEIDLERQALVREQQASQQRETDVEDLVEQVKQLKAEFEEVQQQRDESEAVIDELRRERGGSQDAQPWQETPLPESPSAIAEERRGVDAEQKSSTNSEDDSDLNEPDMDISLQPTVEEDVRESDEVSVEDYMSQLLQRVGGHANQPAPAPAPAVTLPKKVPAPPVPPPKAVEPPVPKTSAEGSELVPRAQPLPLDMVALRDVANQTARQAIERHTSRIWLQAAMGKWFVVAVSTMATGGLLYWSRRYSARFGFGLTAACLVALVWASQAIWLTHRAVRVRLAERHARKQGQTSARGTPLQKPRASRTS